MRTPQLDRSVIKAPGWWQWVLTVPLLVAHLAGNVWAIPVASGLCAFAAAVYFARLRHLHSYPVQIRVAYIFLLACGMVPGMEWIHWVQLIGTTVFVLVGYCLLARLLSLLPFNRLEPLTANLVWRIMWTNPSSGGLMTWMDPLSELNPANSCLVRKAMSIKKGMVHDLVPMNIDSTV